MFGIVTIFEINQNYIFTLVSKVLSLHYIILKIPYHHPVEWCNVEKVVNIAITFALLFVAVASVSCIFILLSDLP